VGAVALMTLGPLHLFGVLQEPLAWVAFVIIACISMLLETIARAISLPLPTLGMGILYAVAIVLLVIVMTKLCYQALLNAY
jgi:hypothetical protein